MTVLLGRSTGLSHPGRKRRRNEDAWVCQPPLFAVADGMGGARGGEIASRVAATALGETVDGSGEQRVVALIQKANRQVFDRAREDADASGMGTTITVALVEDGVVAIGHVGDSRAYLIRDHKVEQLTEDHSLVAELVRSGRLSPEEAEIHPQRSVITRALGTDPDVDVDSFSVEARAGDVFLICSDGLTSMIDDETILGIVEPRRDDLERGREGADRSGESQRRRGQHHRRLLRDDRQGAGASGRDEGDARDAGARSSEHRGRRGHPVRPRGRAGRPDDGRRAGRSQGEHRRSAEPEPPKERFSVQAARLVVALAVVAALALLVYWLLGQSR